MVVFGGSNYCWLALCHLAKKDYFIDIPRSHSIFDDLVKGIESARQSSRAFMGSTANLSVGVNQSISDITRSTQEVQISSSQVATAFAEIAQTNQIQANKAEMLNARARDQSEKVEDIETVKEIRETLALIQEGIREVHGAFSKGVRVI